MIAATLNFARKAVEEGEAVVDLCVSQSALQSSSVRFARVQEVRIGKPGKAGEITLLLVVREEEESLVLDDRAADGAAELVTHVLRLDADRT